MSPVQRTLKYLRDHGYTAEKTEHFNFYAKKRQDLFGFIDVLAVKDEHLLALQVSDGAHHAGHTSAIKALPVARQLVFHMDVEIWSWSKRGRRGKRGGVKLPRWAKHGGDASHGRPRFRSGHPLPPSTPAPTGSELTGPR